jgi:hypothetical protein
VEGLAHPPRIAGQRPGDQLPCGRGDAGRQVRRGRTPRWGISRTEYRSLAVVMEGAETRVHDRLHLFFGGEVLVDLGCGYDHHACGTGRVRRTPS